MNGRELRKYSSAKLKGYFACVFQDHARYQLTMREEITLGSIGEDKQKLQKAVERSGLSALSESRGIDSPIGNIYEDGTDVWGGEW